MHTRRKTAKEKESGCSGLEVNLGPAVNKDSPMSSKSTVSSLQIDPNQVGQLAWVQCENESCLKWREISHDEVEHIKRTDKPWFCSMNTNSQHNSCDRPEEKFVNDKVVRRYGFRIVHAILPVGSLVWARMPGHVRWPAILSPWAGQYVEKDRDGDPTFYHVEFLGKSHTQYWVHSRNIQAYGECLKPEPPQKCGRGFHGKKKRHTTSAASSRHNTTYFKKLEESVTEAESLKVLTSEERLQRCIFKYERTAPSMNDVKEEENETRGLGYSLLQRKAVKQSHTQRLPSHAVLTQSYNITNVEPIPKKKKPGRPPKNVSFGTGIPHTYGALQTSPVFGVIQQDINGRSMQRTQAFQSERNKKKKTKKQKKKKKKSKHKKHKKNKQFPIAGHQNDPYKWQDTQEWNHETWNPLYAAAPLASPRQMMNNVQLGSQAYGFHSRPLQQAQMISKEERLQADIQSLRRDEHEFHNSLRAFLRSKGINQRKGPCWQGRDISLYQLFMAVQERGGFHKVCAVTGAWQNIYQDVTNTIMKQGSFGMTARKYYQRNLLQYELSCIRGSHQSPSRIIPNYSGPTIAEQRVPSVTNMASFTNDIPSIPPQSSTLPQSPVFPNLPDATASPARLKTVSCSFSSGSSCSDVFRVDVPRGAMSPSSGDEDGNEGGGKWNSKQDFLSDVANLLDEETDQTVEEIEMIKSMLEAVDDTPALDRPTHTVTPCHKPSPLSSKRPFEFYSLDYQPVDATTKDQALSKPKRYIDDTQIVPNIYLPSQDSIPSQSLLHGHPSEPKEFNSNGVDKDMLPDMDQLVQDIDLLDQELSQQWMEI